MLQGKESGSIVDYRGTLPAWVNTGASIQDGHMVEEYVTEEVFVDDSGTETSYQIKHAAGTLDFSAFNGTDKMKNELKGGGFFTTCFTCQRHYSIRFTDGSDNTVENSGGHYIYNIGIDNVKNAEELVAAIIKGTDGGNPDGHFTKLTADPANPGKLIVYDDRASSGDPIAQGTSGRWKGWDNPDFDIKKDNYPNDGKFGQGYAVSTDINGDIVLQVGAKKEDILKVDLPNISSAELNIRNITLWTQEGSSEAVRRLKNAIRRLSDERGRMDAYENRLDHTFLVLNNYNENLTKAESQIRDTDMAQEITEYTKNSIILQSAQNMLIKANLMPETILQLLQ